MPKPPSIWWWKTILLMAGRPLEQASANFTDRETVRKVEQMKVSRLLNRCILPWLCTAACWATS